MGLVYSKSKVILDAKTVDAIKSLLKTECPHANILTGYRRIPLTDKIVFDPECSRLLLAGDYTGTRFQVDIPHHNPGVALVVVQNGMNGLTRQEKANARYYYMFTQQHKWAACGNHRTYCTGTSFHFTLICRK
jgi:hypothetical protein